jgi:NAD(P)-dependent dehydrogenase (short-subunit alcohol dehydrogenase family)
MSVSTSRILVTGSADGLGLAAALELIHRGHHVMGHARNAVRAQHLRAVLPDIEEVLIADSTSLGDIRRMASQLHALGPLDAIIHNAGVGYREPRRIATEDNHPHVLQINTLAPYLLTVLAPRPKRLVWLSSGLHREGNASVEDITWKRSRWNGFQAYADSKLFDATLSAAFARLWPDVRSNALEPGWVATKMGGAGAPDDLTLAHVTQVWLAEGTDPASHDTGRYYFHQKEVPTHHAVEDRTFQNKLLDACAQLTGVRIPVVTPATREKGDTHENDR